MTVHDAAGPVSAAVQCWFPASGDHSCLNGPRQKGAGEAANITRGCCPDVRSRRKKTLLSVRRAEVFRHIVRTVPGLSRQFGSQSRDLLG